LWCSEAGGMRGIPLLSRPGAVLSSLALVVILPACSTGFHKRSADREAYSIIEKKQKAALGRSSEFTIDTRHSDKKAQKMKPAEIIADREQSGKKQLKLDDALSLAVKQSREFQNRKELLYLSALNLSSARHEFGTTLSGGADAAGTRAPNGTNAGDQSGGVGSFLGLNRLFKTGGRVALNLTNDILRFYTGDPRRSAVSAVSLNIVQPLLRGAGSRVVAESLTQAERDVIYEVRSFSRFQADYSVAIISDYYRLLQQEDTLQNEKRNFERLSEGVKRAEALAHDRLPEFQVDQARQDELRAKSRYILAVERYKNSLDQFKIRLGIPLGMEVELDRGALTRLHEVGLIPLLAGEGEAYKIAVKQRLDLLNEIDRFEDSQRRILVAADGLKPGLGLSGSGGLASRGPNDYTTFNFQQYQANLGLSLDLPFDRLDERNAYRRSLINFESQARSLELALDQIRNDVRSGLRALQQARESYELQSGSLALANRRVDSATLLIQAGRAQIRDLLEAQSAQLQAQNQLTQSLIDYHLARLNLLTDVGALDIEKPEFWIKNQEVVQIASNTRR
jgi:outer membrane protein TolC